MEDNIRCRQLDRNGNVDSRKLVHEIDGPKTKSLENNYHSFSSCMISGSEVEDETRRGRRRRKMNVQSAGHRRVDLKIEKSHIDHEQHLLFSFCFFVRSIGNEIESTRTRREKRSHFDLSMRNNGTISV